MATIKNRDMYEDIMKRVDELTLRDENAPKRTKEENSELALLVELVAEYESENIHLEPPTVAEVLQYKMSELGINQTELAARIGVSSSRVSEILNGKREPTFSVAKRICKELRVSPCLILGVMESDTVSM